MKTLDIPSEIEDKIFEIKFNSDKSISKIEEAIHSALEQTPPELAADIVDSGIVLTGGGALLKNLDRLLQEETGIPVIIAEDPLTCVARGCGKTLDQLDYFKNTFVYE